MINDVFREINQITSHLIRLGFSVKQNVPIIRNNEVTWADQVNLSAMLKDESYTYIYSSIDQSNNYNFKLIDGALVQLSYRFDRRGRVLLGHRLAFFPSPNLERYEEEREFYEEHSFGESQYHNILEKYIVTFPVRFDYDADEDKHVDVNHPISHVHFGQYENCRVPVCSPLSPNLFMHFILRNFYYQAFIEYNMTNILPINLKFNSCITQNEVKILHFNIT